MATAQKKPTSSGKRAAPKKTTKKAPPPAAGKPVRREVGALLCLVLGLLAALGYFKLEGIAINLVCNLFSGLFGFGFYFVPPALFIAAGILATHRGRPVRLRVSCCLLLPLIIGALIQLMLSAALPTEHLVKTLWTSGLARASGGVLSGLLTHALIMLVSKVGTGLLLAIALLFCVLTSWNIHLIDIIDYVRNRPYVAYEEIPPAPTPKREEPVSAPKPRKRPAMDIPLSVDETPSAPPVQAQPVTPAPEPAVPTAEKKSLFRKKSDVKSPDEVLAQLDAQEETKQAPAQVEDLGPELPKLQVEPVVEKVRPQEAAAAAREVAAEISEQQEREIAPYHFPPMNLLAHPVKGNQDARGELKENAERLNQTLASFNIDARITNITRGPSVTRYELELDQGVRLNRLTNLADDIALSLGATGVRIAPIPGQISMVGVEVPNKLVTPVPLAEVIGSKEFQEHKSRVSFAVGKDIGDHFIVGDIARLPHLLIAGTTGSGKSVCTNSIIISLLYKSAPEDVRFIMVDPKMVELNVYNGIPHLLIPVVTDPKKAAGALQWAVTEMMKRYRMFSEVGAKDLSSYNSYAAKHDMEHMPQIVVIIDELADLMLVAAKEVEESICRVAQMGRASGMHLIIATQRPSADVITGLMKANIPSRIAFSVASSLESRIILDHVGAEKLVGRGDMLYLPVGAGKPQRVQGTLIMEEEIAAVVEYVKRTSESNYSEDIMKEIEHNAAQTTKGGGASTSFGDGNADDDDELLPTAIEIIIDSGQASVSMLQRRLKLGHSRAGRLMDAMEEKGIVGPHEGSKPREILITKEQWQERQMRTGEYGSAPEASAAVMEEAPVPLVEEPQDLAETLEDAPPFELE